MKKKRCSVCKSSKPLAEFGPDKRTRDKHASACLDCERDRARKKREGQQEPAAPPPAGNYKGPSLATIRADIREVDPALAKRCAAQLATIRDYEALPPEDRAVTAAARLRLEAANKVTDLLEKRRAEKMEAQVKADALGELRVLMDEKLEVWRNDPQRWVRK